MKMRAWREISEANAASDATRRAGQRATPKLNHLNDSAPCSPKITMHTTAVAKTKVKAV